MAKCCWLFPVIFNVIQTACDRKVLCNDFFFSIHFVYNDKLTQKLISGRMPNAFAPLAVGSYWVSNLPYLTLQFMELNAFSVSFKRNAFVSISAIIHSKNGSFSTSWLALSCKDPEAFAKSFLRNTITASTAILLRTSSTPTGLKPKFLYNDINLFVVKASKACKDCRSSEQCFLMKYSLPVISIKAWLSGTSFC